MIELPSGFATGELGWSAAAVRVSARMGSEVVDSVEHQHQRVTLTPTGAPPLS